MQSMPTKSLFAFFKDSHNPEYGQAVIRLVLGLMICSYGFVVYFTGWFGGMPNSGFFVTSAFQVFALINLVSVILAPEPSHTRKILCITTDLATATYMLIVGGVATAALYGIYLWVVLANGLRYGKDYMRYSNVISIIGFSFVLMLGDFWRENLIFGCGLMLWLFMLPIYVAKLLHRIEEAVDKANAANEAKSQFLANMSHEIRTPLTAIIGFAEAANDTSQSASARESALNTIAKSGNHLLTIINDILDFSKIEANKLEIERVEVNPFQLVDDIKSIMQEEATHKMLSLAVQHHFPLPVKITTDPVRLKQILINLCGNAIKFTDSGSIEIGMSYDNTTRQIIFCVSDTGIGMSDEQMSKIFNPFVQADTSTTRQYGGTGLGLTLTRQLSELLGGYISVASTPGNGTTFTVFIDAGTSETETLITDFTELEQSQNSGAKFVKQHKLQGKILVAEDNPNNQQLFMLLLKKMGAEVTIAENGKVALEQVQNCAFDLIFMDMQMPIMSGPEAVKEMRRQNIMTPIVALTANATKQDKQHCLDTGCNEFLTKPVLQQQLYDMASKYLAPSNALIDESTPLISNILEEEPDFLDLVEKFVAQLPTTIHKINEHMLKHKWQELKGDIHSLKGVGTAFGFPQLTHIAKNIEDALHATDYTTTQQLINSLNNTCDRIYLGMPDKQQKTA